MKNNNSIENIFKTSKFYMIITKKVHYFIKYYENYINIKLNDLVSILNNFLVSVNESDRSSRIEFSVSINQTIKIISKRLKEYKSM